MVCTAWLAACASDGPSLSSGERSTLVLAAPVQVPYRGGSLTLLPGRYVPEAGSDEGVWYRAESGVLAGNTRTPEHDAGVFVTHDRRRWGVWVADADYMEMRREPMPPFRAR